MTFRPPGLLFSVKSKQLEAITNILCGHDTLAILPTSYGKSMIFQLIPPVCKQLSNQPSNPIVIVFSPLTSLIKNQIEEANKLSSLSLNACSLGSADFELLCKGHYNLIIDTPESWLNDNRWKNVLSSRFFRLNLKCIVVDEVHQVSWGTSSSPEGKIFREAFSRIGSVRSFCSESVPVLALSATVDTDYTELISTCCSLSKSLKVIHTCSNRKNIILSVVRLKIKDIDCFHWLFHLLITFGVKCPKVLIYCRSQSLMGWLFEQFLLHLGKHMYKDGIISPDNFLIGMYHANTLDRNKDKVMNSLTKDTGLIRILISTSALGCGVNCKNLSYVCHFGPSHGVVDYCQQIGRAGRSGEKLCHAILYTYPQSSLLISKEMKDYVSFQSLSCYRSKLFTPFNQNNETIPPLLPAHACCSFCSLNCNCGNDDCLKIYKFEIVESQVNEDDNPLREIKEEDKSKITSLLESYHESRSSNFSVPSAFSSGLTSQIIKDIVSNLAFINSADYLISNYVPDDILAKEIFHIIEKYFEGFSYPLQKRVKINDVNDEPQQYEFSDFLSSDSDFDDEL